jgi:hypothetical protein
MSARRRSVRPRRASAVGVPARAGRARGVTPFLERDASLLELVDNLLEKGVMLSGDVVLSIAGVDLVYLRLSALLCAVDRVLEPPRSARAAR